MGNPNKKNKKYFEQIWEIQKKIREIQINNFLSFFYYIEVFIDSEMRSRGY
jgi:hypothetical protein